MSIKKALEDFQAGQEDDFDRDEGRPGGIALTHMMESMKRAHARGSTPGR